MSANENCPKCQNPMRLLDEAYRECDPDAAFCPICQPNRMRAHIDENRWNTAFNRQANEICRHLLGAVIGINEFLEDHGDDCDCEFCVNYPQASFDLRHDLEGIRWGVQIGASFVGNVIWPDDETAALDRHSRGHDDDDEDETEAAAEVQAEKLADEPLTVAG